MSPHRPLLAVPSAAPDPSGRVPPNDLDAEAAVLSAILLCREAVARVRDILRPEHFYSDANGRIFEVVLDLTAKGQPVDTVLVASALRDRGRFTEVGGASYLGQLADATPAVAHVEAHAQIIFNEPLLPQDVVISRLKACQQARAVLA